MRSGRSALTHIGFKDVGVAPEVLPSSIARIRASGATSYMEVVSTSREACLQSARVARDIGVDRLLGGTQVDEVLAILAGSAVDVPAVSRQAVRSSDQARRHRRRRSRPTAGGSGARLRRGRSARVSRDRGRSDRARARGAARHDGTLLVAGSVQTRRADPRARRGRRRCVHDRLGGVRWLVRAAHGLAALAAESGPRCLPLIRSGRRSCSPGSYPIPRPASCSPRGALGRDRRLARRSRGRARRGARSRPRPRDGRR